MRNPMTIGRAVLPAAAIGVLALAACGSSGASGGGAQAATGGGGAAAMTVTVSDVSGHSNVLTAPDGHTLYMSDQEHGRVLCKSSACTAIWHPLTLSAGQTPTAPNTIKRRLTTVKRPDGSTQVALNGKPLYEFSFDHGSGEVGGDGQKDSFDGTDFTWHVATAAAGTGSAPSAPAPSAPAPSYGNGGYNYP